MPGRGLLTATCLVLIALSCLSVVRKLERERRLLRRLRALGAMSPATGLPLKEFPAEDRHCARSLQSAGVLTVEQGRCYLRTGSLSPFKRKRLRLALSGGLMALMLAILVATLILRR